MVSPLLLDLPNGSPSLSLTLGAAPTLMSRGFDILVQ
jgi:hypothetical protein